MKSSTASNFTKFGHLHPVTQFVREVHSVFSELGFEIADGPELETEHYNFDALNVPVNHPSRDTQDTFWLKVPSVIDGKNKDHPDKLLLRTQTSPVQVRFMENNKPPVKIIVPGKVYRNEATDATHEVQFHQLEGLYVDEDVSVAHLKWTISFFLKKLFGEKVQIKFRPSFFPFTEPSLEVVMKWKDKWLEIIGAGMVHPSVLKAVGLDPQKWSGFAFGVGIDRLIMLKTGIDDIRLLYSGDLRLINQF